jgi:hypothetical protein
MDLFQFDEEGNMIKKPILTPEEMTTTQISGSDVFKQQE